MSITSHLIKGRKGGLLLLLALTLTLTAVAQPAKRRTDTATAPTKRGSVYREFPVAQAMPEDADWRRDIYRSLDLTKDENAVLYYPQTPKNGRENLFVYLFKLVLRGQVKAYNYTLDGNEDFSVKNQVSAKELMDRYQFFYEVKDGRMRVNDADLPSHQVSVYFLKESTYYDQHTGTFRSQVTALCPVRSAGSDLGSFGQTPLFWLKYEDIAPYLAKFVLSTSNYNNAAAMSADDYFTQACYKGDIYKTENLQDRVLINDYESNDSLLAKERRRIERQLIDVQKNVWQGDSIPPKPNTDEATTDSTATEATTSRLARRRTTTLRRTTTKKPTTKKRSTGSAVLTVRRERR